MASGPLRIREKRGRCTLVTLAVGCLLALMAFQVAPKSSRLLLAFQFSAGSRGAALLLVSAGAAVVQAAAGLEDLTEVVATFQGFVSSHRRELERLWRGRLERLPERGIVISAGSPGTLANAFVSLQVLRHKLGCMLPVTVM